MVCKSTYPEFQSQTNTLTSKIRPTGAIFVKHVEKVPVVNSSGVRKLSPGTTTTKNKKIQISLPKIEWHTYVDRSSIAIQEVQQPHYYFYKRTRIDHNHDDNDETKKQLYLYLYNNNNPVVVVVAGSDMEQPKQ